MKDVLTNDNNIYINGKTEESFKLLHGIKKYDLISINNNEICDDVNYLIKILNGSLELLNKDGMLIISMKENDCGIIKHLIELLCDEMLQVFYFNSNEMRYCILTYNKEISTIPDGKLGEDFINDKIIRAVTILEICEDKVSSIVNKVHLLDIIDTNKRYVTIISDHDNLMNTYISQHKYLNFKYICIQ